MTRLDNCGYPMKCVLAALVVECLLGCSSSPNRVLEARGYVLMDSMGRRRAALELADDTDNPRLALFSRSGKRRIVLAIDDGSLSLVRMYDGDGCIRVSLGEDDSGSWGIVVYDDEETPRLGVMFLDLLSSSGKTIVGSPRISLHDASAKERAALWLDPGGEPSAGFWDKKGAIRAKIEQTSGGRVDVKVDRCQ